MKKLLFICLMLISISLQAHSDKHYILTLELRQVSYSFFISKQIKDVMNKVTFQIPVDVNYYNSVQIGTIITDEFRVGSLLMHGSFGKWRIKVINKQIVQ